jgi:3-phosphoshikimate 1-carboxyvinyltransferase
MRKSVYPSEIKGTITAPASKSVMQRAVAAALLSESPVAISNPSFCDDSQAAIHVARSLGARVEWKDDRVVIQGGIEPRESVVDCGESGLCIRMFTPIAALYEQEIQLTGQGSLRERPMGMIEQPISDLGAACTTRNGFLPLMVKGPLKGGHAHVDASIGSQFLTGLLMALPKAEMDSFLSVDRLTSIPYIQLTLRMLDQFNISVTHQDFHTFQIKGSQKYRRAEYWVEGDWSGAAFIMVAAALSGTVRIQGLDLDSPQGDKQIIDVLGRSGAKVSITPHWVEVSRAPLEAFEFDVTHCPDLAPPLVTLASRAQGLSVIHGMERLVHKESSRAEALLREFKSLGVDIGLEGNRMVIQGGAIQGGRVDSHRDHRIAMAAAVAAIVAEDAVSIEGADCVNKSYPDFFKDLRSLGGKVHE